jgi:hypothetical protein
MRTFCPHEITRKHFKKINLAQFAFESMPRWACFEASGHDGIYSFGLADDFLRSYDLRGLDSQAPSMKLLPATMTVPRSNRQFFNPTHICDVHLRSMDPKTASPWPWPRNSAVSHWILISDAWKQSNYSHDDHGDDWDAG